MPSSLDAILQQSFQDREGARTTAHGSTLTISPQFVEVAAEIGVRHTFYSDTIPRRYFLPEVMGGGAGWLDFDLDGCLDVYYANGCPVTERPEDPSKYYSPLFRNRGDGTFTNVTLAAAAGVCRYGQGIAVGDFDSDGFPDLFLANYGPDVLLHNLGDGTFEEVTDQTRGMADNLWGAGATWWDADQDGDLDLYVVNYMDVTLQNSHSCEYQSAWGFCGPGEYEGVPDCLFINNGDGTFVESLDAFGMTAEHGKGLVIQVADFDGDLTPEVYVGNDMTANFLFASPNSAIAKAAGKTSDKRFVEVASVAGCAVSRDGLNEATMGIACADYDRDGLIDIYLTHFFNNKNTLYKNMGNLSFTDDSFRTRVAATSMNFNGFGCVPIDYDRDGWSDLLITNGHVLGPEFDPYEMRPQLLRNEGRAMFADISDTAGDYFQKKWLGRGLAAADYDNDGDVDVTISHIPDVPAEVLKDESLPIPEVPVAVLRNETQTGRDFLGLDLRTWNRIPPVGGKVVVKYGTGSQTLPLMAGGSYESTHDSRLLVGLEDHTGPVDVEIHWPSGQVDHWNNLAPNQYHIMYEGLSLN